VKPKSICKLQYKRRELHLILCCEPPGQGEREGARTSIYALEDLQFADALLLPSITIACLPEAYNGYSSIIQTIQYSLLDDMSNNAIMSVVIHVRRPQKRQSQQRLHRLQGAPLGIPGVEVNLLTMIPVVLPGVNTCITINFSAVQERLQTAKLTTKILYKTPEFYRNTECQANSIPL
jgi:hypothetical protein